MSTNAHFNFGSRIAAARAGVDGRELLQRAASQSVMDSAEAAPFNRSLCKIAAEAFAVDGASRTPPGLLFSRLAALPVWDAGYNRFSDCVKRALAKQASLLPMAYNGLGGTGVKALVAGGAVGGATLGSLAFLLSRNASQTSAENAELLEKVRAFKQLKRDIEEDMASDELTAPIVSKERRHNV